MSILIKGADISPERILCITVFPEGFAVVEEYEMLLPIKTTKCEVASVPTPHGRLIDADALLSVAEPIEDRRGNVKRVVWDAHINRRPTVIEAEEG